MIDAFTCKKRGEMNRTCLFLICFASFLFSLPYIQTLGDDTFIYMRLINNFLQTGRMEYNIGEPCYLFTSVTWFFSWAGATSLLKNIDMARYLLSFLSHIFAFLMVLLVAKKLIRNRFILFITLAIIFFDPFYLRWFWAGWEVSPKIALSALLIFVLLSIDSCSSRKKYFLAGFCAGLAVLTRPEMMFLAFFGFILILVKYPRKLTHLFLYIFAMLVVLLPWFLFAYDTFGWILPHTIFAKTNSNITLDSFLHSGIRLTKIVITPQLPLFFLLFIVSLVPRKDSSEKTGSESFLARYLSGVNKQQFLNFLLVAIWGCAVFGYLLVGSTIASIHTSLFVPFFALMLGSVVDFVAYRNQCEWLNKKIFSILVVVIIFITISIQTLLYYRFSYFNPDYRLGTDKDFVEFSLKVKEMTKPNDTIGLWELGVIGYYTDRYIIDFVGLATPQIVDYKRKFAEKYLEKYLEETGLYPNYIIRQFKFKNSQYKVPSHIDLKTYPFYCYEYEPIYSQKIRRIGGGRMARSLDLMVLYKRSAHALKSEDCSKS